MQNFEINLDDEEECESFLFRCAAFEKDSSVRLPFGLENDRKAFQRLFFYASLKSIAFRARRVGEIELAFKLEDLGNDIYSKLSFNFKW